MNAVSLSQAPSILDHNLTEHFSRLAAFESTSELEKSSLYQQLKSQIELILNSIASENFASRVRPQNKDKIVRALAWNIERGIQLPGIVDALENHADLRDRDLLLLTELDYGMARSGNRFVAREIAQKLKLNYVFAPCYLALNKGSGVEAQAAGANRQSLHGLGVFSPHPVSNARVVPLPPGKDKMRGKEKRIGSLRGLVADIEHPAGTFRAVCVHLDAHSSRAHRVRQMEILLAAVDKMQPALPVVIGGDWNTTTHNAQNARRAILGYCRRVMMGVQNVVTNHYPHPERFFERELFEKLGERGFSYRELNALGCGTLHYEMENIATNTNLADWVPSWCFPWIFWAMSKVGGRCSLRLDWFAGRGIKAAESFPPRVVGNLHDAATNAPLSDHDAIVLDFTVNS
jgi:endonuclease/exonuclease/phosphatase family metal-dependent hydrolase